MRLIKQQTTNLRRIQPSSKGVKQDMDDQIVMVSERALRVPVGTLPAASAVEPPITDVLALTLNICKPSILELPT